MIKIIILLFNIIFPLFINNTYADQHLPKHKAIPGGIAIIPLDIKTIEVPVAFFNDKQVIVTKYRNHTEKTLNWVAIVGIPVITKPGMQKIYVHAEKTSHNQFKINFEKSFLVSYKEYPVEKLKIDPNLVTPIAPIDRIRALKETEAIKNAYRHWSNQIPNLKFTIPVSAARKSSVFGLKRILNGTNKGYHSGLDLAAPIGTPVIAASSGIVILTGNFFYTGNTIFIDHGQGLITSYFHLNSINVNEGDFIESESIIGTLGKTGRVTGPHLHWSVSLNDARINPELFLN